MHLLWSLRHWSRLWRVSLPQVSLPRLWKAELLQDLSPTADKGNLKAAGQNFLCSDINNTDCKDTPAKKTSGKTREPPKIHRWRNDLDKRRKLIHLGGKKYVSLRQHCNHVCVNIRSYSNNDNRALMSTKRGVMLTPCEWECLKANVRTIDDRLNARKLLLTPLNTL